jgi:hypothetical protein
VKKQAFTHLKMPMVHLCHELRLHGIHRVLFVGDAIMRRLFLASILRFIPPDMRSRSGNVLQPTPRWAPSSARIFARTNTASRIGTSSQAAFSSRSARSFTGWR